MPDVVWYFVWARVVGVCAVARVRAVQPNGRAYAGSEWPSATAV